MNEYIAYCGLDCTKCEAFIATKNNDDKLREAVAKKWSELNNVQITKDMINCEGCRQNGLKTPFCESLCEIRKCAMKNKFETCGNCKDLNRCNKIKMIIDHNDNVLSNLAIK